MSYSPVPKQIEDSAGSDGFTGVPILGVRQDGNTSPVSANGDYHPFVFNDLGRLKTAGAAAQFTPVDMNVSATQPVATTPVANATAYANVEEASNVMCYVTGTFAAMNCTFEGSLDSTNGTDGTWFGLQAIRSSANTVETTTGSLSAAPAYAWECSVNALAWFRLRCTARTSGTQAWKIRLGSYATEPIPAAQITGTQPVSGTVTSNLGTGGTAATSLGKAEDASASNGDTGVAVWGVRADTLPNATSTNGDYSQLTVDRAGIQIVAGAPRELKARQVTTLTSTTAETTIITAIASTFNDIYGLILSNTSAAATEVTIRDATAGGTITSIMVPAGDTRGFMLPLDSAIPQATVNNNWTATCGTSVASLKVTALFVKRL